MTRWTPSSSVLGTGQGTCARTSTRPARTRSRATANPCPRSCSARGATGSGCSRRSCCDYGANILLGERVFFNFNCVVLDVCRVTIGDYTLFGPAVQIYTATHPMNAELRRDQESGKPIELG